MSHLEGSRRPYEPTNNIDPQDVRAFWQLQDMEDAAFAPTEEVPEIDQDSPVVSEGHDIIDKVEAAYAALQQRKAKRNSIEGTISFE